MKNKIAVKQDGVFAYPFESICCHFVSIFKQKPRRNAENWRVKRRAGFSEEYKHHQSTLEGGSLTNMRLR